MLASASNIDLDAAACLSGKFGKGSSINQATIALSSLARPGPAGLDPLQKPIIINRSLALKALAADEQIGTWTSPSFRALPDQHAPLTIIKHLCRLAQVSPLARRVSPVAIPMVAPAFARLLG